MRKVLAPIGAWRLMVFFVIAALPLALLAAAPAAGLLPGRIPVLGGSKALMPAQVDTTMFLGSIFVGIIAGLITGVIGAGGGYILTPALMSFGVRGIMAVGTDQFHLFAKAIMGTTIHRKMGNVNVRLAAWFVAGSLGGVTAGGALNRAIFQLNPALSDSVISTVYVVVLGVLGFFAIGDYVRLRRQGAVRQDAAPTGLPRILQSLRLPPFIRFDETVVSGGRRISVYPVILCGLIVGFVASIMGVGGGFLTFPMFVYGLGVSTFTTVGTDILQIIFTTAYSSIFQYAIYGFVFFSVAMGMLLGSLIGVQVGALVTRVVKGSVIRGFYALTILAGFSNRLFALPRKLADLGYLSLSRAFTAVCEGVGNVVFFGIVGTFSVWILAVFFRNIGSLRGGASRLVVDPRKFRLGIGGLALFTIVFVLAVVPLFGGRNLLGAADDLFNRLAKHSVYSVPKGRAEAEKFAGTSVDFGIAPRDFADAGVIAAVVSASGTSAKALDDGRVRITGDLGAIAEAAIDAADAVFADSEGSVRPGAGGSALEAIYAWWIVFDGLTRRFTQEEQTAKANFTKYVSTKILEPAYNFRGIQARGLKASIVPVVGLLAFYLGYTILYGMSILFLFEGLGINASQGGRKREV